MNDDVKKKDQARIIYFILDFKRLTRTKVRFSSANLETTVMIFKECFLSSSVWSLDGFGMLFTK